MNNKELIKKLAKLLKEYRRSHGITQVDMADILKIHTNQLSRIERLGVDIRVSTLFNFLEEANVLEEFFTLIESTIKYKNSDEIIDELTQ